MRKKQDILMDKKGKTQHFDTRGRFASYWNCVAELKRFFKEGIKKRFSYTDVGKLRNHFGVW
jgi:hypothetical protein